MPQPRALKPNTRVGTYAIVEVVDTNSHSVIYRALEEGSGREYWLQEYIPQELAIRRSGSAMVEPLPGLEAIFEEALTRFLQEARVLSQIRDPYVCRIREYAEAAGTAFLSMDLESGTTLDAYLAQHDELSQDELCNLFVPVLKGLRVVHSHGLIHRDINPRSIFIRDGGLPLLVGFGSTHRTLPIGNSGLEYRITPGYSPVEQYGDQGDLGPWTDLYAVGAMMYRSISGSVPTAADQRMASLAEGEPDPVLPAVEGGRDSYDSRILEAIDWLMRPKANDRPQAVSDVLTAFVEDDEHDLESESELENETPPTPEAQKELKLDSPRLYADPSTRMPPKQVPSGSNPLFWIISVGLLAAVGVFTFWPQIKPFLSPPRQDVAQAPSKIEGTKIPEDILDRPLPGDAPPDLPESVKFTRKADDIRMEQYRQLDQNDKKIQALLRTAKMKMERGELIESADENALASFRAVLLLDDDNFDALQGLDEIGSILVQRARDNLKNGETSTAGEMLDELERTGIEVKGIADIRRQIDERIESGATEEESTTVQGVAPDQQFEGELTAEQERLAKEERARQQAIAEQERLEDERLAERERLEEQKRAEQEQLELERLAEQKRIDEAKLAEKERLQENQRLKQEKLAQERLAEQKRLREAALVEQERLEELRRAEQEKLEQDRIAEQKRLEELQLAEQKRLEEARRAEQERLEKQRLAEEERSQQVEKANRVNSLLLQARTATGGKELSGSTADAALPWYQQVLAIDPGNTEALAGISSIHRFYLEQANTALAVDRFDDVEKNLQLAARIKPDSEMLELLRQQMKLRQSALASARQQQIAAAADSRTNNQARLAELDEKQMAKGINAYYSGRYETAFNVLEPLAERGNARAQFRIGVMYLRGRGVEQNLGAGTSLIEKAFPKIQVAALAGEAWAQADLGSLYQTGLLVAKNNKEAVRWYLAAAEQGYAGAQTNLGAMYADGKGVAQNRTEAVKWLRLAAEQGDKVARDNLSALGVQNLN